jgi:multidrug efflux pump subunit AcrB
MFLKELIGVFVRHRNASNLLMLIMIGIGFFSLNKINTQFFPNIGLDVISITVAWPGASAEDVEGNIILAIEPEVRFVDSVKRVTSSASEGFGSVVVEFVAGADMQAALSNIDSAIGRITTLPEDSERPVINKVVRYDSISRMSLSGPFSEKALKTLAKRVRDDLLDRGIAKVDLTGARDEEIWVEVDARNLRRLDMTLGDIGDRIRNSSQDMPSGTVEGEFESQIRSLGLATSADGIADIEVRALDNGQKIALRDIATISDTFNSGDIIALQDGSPAIGLQILRATSADALQQSEIVDKYLQELRPTLPPGLNLKYYDVRAGYIQDRINLLLRNGASGLVLVLGVLFLFLSSRLAFWVAAGIPVAMMATMGAMLFSGQSINMISLFALIMTLGIIVDDAIVVGEHAATRRSKGMGAIDAAETGAIRMLAPVLSSSMTTIAAFLPIFMISDVIGQVISAIPFVVIAVLVASLIECFLVLPGHLRGALPKQGEKSSGFRLWFDTGFNAFRDGAFQRFVRLCLHWRYGTIACALAFLILSIGIIAGGRVGFSFFPAPEGDTIFANVIFSPGSPRSQTERMIRDLEQALDRAEAKVTDGQGGLVKARFSKVGASQAREFESRSGDQLGGIHVELVPADFRTIRTSEFIEAWRAEVVPIPGIDRVSLSAPAQGPPGREIDIRLSRGSTAMLKGAASEVKALLSRYPGISDVEDNLPYGKREVILKVTPRGHALGFTTQSVGRQVRDAFEGRIAKRFARGDEEILVRVQFPRGAVGGGTLRSLHLRGPGGAEVPLSEIVEVRESRGFARIRREDGSREVAVVAEVDENVISSGETLAALEEGGLKEITARWGVQYAFKGKSEEQNRTLADMRLGAQMGLIAIYIILAWVFASYSLPFIVMAIIPFGLVGAVIGHLVMGFNLSILSMISLLGLAGILVNNSIILVSVIEERLADGQAYEDAIVGGAQDRLRAVLLTSLTTIGGLLPLLFETSLQARFIIPMAITIVFGLAVATLLVLIVVPALLGIRQDIGEILRAPKSRGEKYEDRKKFQPSQ